MTDTTEKPGNARNKAYAAATARLRDAHRDEFNALLTEEYEALGLSPRRRRTAEEIEAEKAAKARVREEKARQKALEKKARLLAEIEALGLDTDEAPDEPSF